jgi:tRNA nucleotidyltransferase (CCA-adding enzyme)
MDQNIKNILKKIEDNGFEAYIVGGFVRDSILRIKTNDVDIVTNALLKDIAKIFPEGKSDTNYYGSYKLKLGRYNVDITTYREEANYKNRKPTEINYVNNLLTDLNRRDFTINSICMNKKGVIVDLLNGRKDLSLKVLRVIGNVNNKFTEDPLRMLRAIRFATLLNFKIEAPALEFIINNKALIKKLSYQRKKNELDLILISRNYKQGLDFIKEISLDEVLEIKYNLVKKTDDLLGMWAQIEYSSNYPFTNQEKSSIKIIKEIVNYGKIDANILFKYDLYHAYIAGDILNINKVIISKLYKLMPIHDYADIDINGKDIIAILEITPSIKIKMITEDIKEAILNKKLKNNKKDITKYLINNKEKWL